MIVNSVGYENLIKLLVNLSVVLFFSLIISTSSGHSVAIVFALLASILSIPMWKLEKFDGLLKYFFIFFVLTGVFWSHTFDSIFSFEFNGDHLLRYLLGVFFFISFCQVGVNPRAIVFGMAFGCISSGLLAIYQSGTIGRAEGFTNAVRFGNIALLMALVCGFASFINFFNKKERVFFLASSCLGMMASVLSLSRGGWVLLLALPLFAYFMFSHMRRSAILLSLAAIPLLFSFTFIPPVKERIEIAKNEFIEYFDESKSFNPTSVGIRLELWKTALMMGGEKPLSGWGDAEIDQRKKEYVDAGVSNEVILKFTHAHNDLIENWARRGALGVVSMLLIYIFPIYLIYMISSKNTIISVEFGRLKRFFVISGFFIYFGYFVFGWTSVFFKFVIGHNFYMFSLIFFCAAISYIDRASLDESTR